MTERWNPRYVAYAAAHGRSPDGQLAADRERWRGGNNTGFILWMNERWAQWRAETGRHTADAWLSAADHEAFDAWLTAGAS